MQLCAQPQGNPEARQSRFAVYKMLFGLAVVAALLGRVRADDARVDLKVGDPAPAFEGTDDCGQPWKSKDHVGKKYVVVYFYPGDFTPSCIRQAQSFCDVMHKLVAKGFEVVGVSGDSVETHQMFKKDQKLNFMLLADEKGDLAKWFGVPVGKGGQAKGKDLQGNPVTVKRALTAQR